VTEGGGQGGNIGHAGGVGQDGDAQRSGVGRRRERHGDVPSGGRDRDDRPYGGAAEHQRVFRAAQVGDEGMNESLVIGEPAQQAGAGQQQESGHEEGGRGAAGMRLTLAGDLGRPGYPGAEIAGGGHGDRHDPDLVAKLTIAGRPRRGHGDRDGDLAELLAARGQQGSQRPGDRGEYHVVDGAAVCVSQVVDGG